MSDLEQWLKEGKYLPPVLRDFHDQKDTFKMIHETISNRTIDQIGWVDGHIYTIDSFLWFMARRGYTLQRNRARLPFRDLVADRNAAKKARDDQMAIEMGLLVVGPQPEKEPV